MITNFFTNRRIYKALTNIRKELKRNETFNVKNLDLKVSQIADYIYKKNKNRFLEYDAYRKKSIGALATELYNVGGHTSCLVNFVQSFYKDYDVHCFLTEKRNSFKRTCNNKIHLIDEIVKIKGINLNKNRISKDIIDLYNLIIESKIKILFLYIHMGDMVSAAVVSLLKKHTDIRIIFFNHADHLPALAFEFADLILDARISGQDLTKDQRGYKNSIIIPLQSKRISETKYYSKKAIKEKRKELGIHDDNYFTLSGFFSHKIFESNKSEYIVFIRELLEKEKKLKHVLVTELNISQRKIIDDIFKDSREIYERFIIIPRITEFDILFQSCDLFIDSFPIGSALTHIDMMRNKRPTVVKINKKQPIYSFEYYLPKNYKYAFDNLEDMKSGILELLHNKKEQSKISEELYAHYLKTFEFEIVKAKYKEIIESI